ncbi:hypothetical protein LS73_006875 [Helicobacter muridarum]|uniref:Dynamin family protein n=1 Tax=Helicobacter muridarum TaxID=216 RepID=A0A377PVH6_9HELI|nr:hypothetical protein [Helicobacter muridarum]TLD99788.1 hypothetical protein LS73_006875 [Helicobacter muridarum]STQ86978.1 Uncharacterised protein [Helicobacter muridarum]
MKKHSTQEVAQKMEILHRFLPIQRISPNNKLQTFFNLIYSKEAPEFILRNEPKELLATHYENPTDIHEVYAIILALNNNNLDLFLKIASFRNICKIFCENIDLLPNKHYGIYLQCLQASILYYIDTKTSKQIIKDIKLLREGGIISFHDEKCIQAAINSENTRKLSKSNKNAPSQMILSFSQLNANHTLLKEQLLAISKARKILQKTSWTKCLTFLCDENFLKKVIIIGDKSAGKSTLISTMLYDSDNKIDNKPLEAIAPILYQYGKGDSKIEYLNTKEMKAFSSLSINNVFANNEAQPQLDKSIQKIKKSKIYEDIYQTGIIKQVKNISICHDSDILKYMQFINTPSLIPNAFRHLQIYEYLTTSNIACYIINTEELLNSNTNKHYEYIASVSFRLLTQDNISYVYLICSQVDKINLTIKKRQTIHNKLLNLIEQRLDKIKQKQEILHKLHFHYVTPASAYNMRKQNTITSESGFDMQSSGVLELERQIFAHIFESPIKHIYVEILSNIIKLCQSDYIQGLEIAESSIDIKECSLEQDSESLDYKNTDSKNDEQKKDVHIDSKEIDKESKNTIKEKSAKLSLISSLLINNKQDRLSSQDRQEIISMLNKIKQNANLIADKLPAKYSSFYVSFKNLRDNLYSQFIQSLNYEMQKRTNFSIKRLKHSTIDSIIIGLQGLSEILQSHFIAHNELNSIASCLDSKNPNSLVRFTKTNEHKEILDILFKRFDSIIRDGYSTDSNNIITEHLSYKLDIVLPDNTKKGAISEESIIKPLKASFEYYFFLLERNIEKLFNTRIALFSEFMQCATMIIESSFINYYDDAYINDKDECTWILKNLVSK